MAAETIIALFITTLATVATFPHPANTEVITQPKPGQEYVFVQSSSIQRKDKARSSDDFETAHKFPSSLIVEGESPRTEKIKKSLKVQKRAADPADAPAPAPAGAIKLDVKKLLERYKTELKTSSTTTPTTSKRTPSRRIKKDADINTKQSVHVTSPRTPLTTGAPISKRDLDDEEDVRLLGAGSEKQRSRIQIKKGPNGQEYEYEYVYYYYDDDDELDNKKTQKVSNSHDGPIRGNNRSPESNEVVPASSNGKSRGRQLGEEIIAEDRLPANTRFPPRSRDLNTTPKSEEESNEGAKSRTRGRGKQPTESESPLDETDNVSDETQSQRDRTRASVRRPSLDLVDNESFNTHTNAVGVSNGPSFPSELPAGPEEAKEIEPIKNTALDSSSKDNAELEEATTETTGMNKVAFDLYAILQGTQKLSGEEDINSDESDTGVETETTTLVPPTEENFEASSTTTVATTTTVTTTTTTTTTTEPPTTKTTTTAAPQDLPGGRRFRGRGRKTTAPTSTTTESPKATAKGGKFGRPRFGRPKQSQSTKATDSHVTEQSVTKQESKPSTHSGPGSSRGRFGASRTRSRTTAAPSEDTPQQDESHSASTPTSRPSLRPRPSFNIRTRTRTTASPSVSEASTAEETESSSHTSTTTARTRRIQSHGAVRPLRPGPRINLARGRPGVQSTTTVTTEETILEDDHVTGDDDSADEPDEAAKATTVSAIDNSPLGRLKNRNRLNIVANRPKPAASVPVQVRRINPLIARKKPGQAEETPSSEAPVEVSTEQNADDVPSTETAEPSKSTTEEPKGLNRLLAGRRRLIGRPHLTTH